MSFASERAVRCLGDQFQYCWLTGCIKTPAVLKRQRFEDSESDATEPRASKRPRVDEHDNEEGQGYLGGYGLYGFNRRRASGARYMAGNSPASRKHRKHDESNVEHGGNASAKG